MAEEPSDFTDLVIQAQRVTLTLDDLVCQRRSKAAAAAISDGKRTYRRLLEYQRIVRLTGHEVHALDEAALLLRARLRFFGEPV
jgi:hypothetical protein